MRRLVLILLLLASSLSLSAQPAAGALQYTVSFQDAPAHILRVRIDLPEGVTHLQLPVWNALYQVRDFAQYVNALGPRECVEKSSPSLWKIHPGCKSITYDYFTVLEGPFGARVDSTHAWLNWAEVLPYDPDDRSRAIAISLQGLPAGWDIRDGGVFCRPQCSPQGSAPNYDFLVDTPVMMGALQQSEFAQDGATYHVAVLADPADYDAAKLSDTVRKVTAAAVDYMQDRPFDAYTFLFHFPQGPGGGGMEHSYSTAIEVSAARLKNDPLAYADVTAHEFFHLWNVKRIRPRTLEPVDYTREQYSRALWFNEGVDSTVTEHLLVRAGLLDEAGFLKRLAQQIDEFESRPAHVLQSAEESSLETWFDKYPFYRTPARSVSYYNKGQILGVLLDLRMRQVSGGRRSLRDLFQYMNLRWARQGQYFDDSESIRLATEVLTGDDFRPFFTDYVAGVRALPYDEFESVGLHLARQEKSVGALSVFAGRGPNNTAVVAMVENSSDAARQGVATGDTITALNGRGVSAAEFNTAVRALKAGDNVTLSLRNAGGEREVHLKASAQQVVEYVFEELPSATTAQKARRAAWLRGDSQPEGDRH